MKPLARRSLPPSPPSAPAAPDALGEHDGVVFQRERLAPILRELTPLIEADWRENGVDHERVPLRLNFGQYLDYDLLGVLQIVTAREDGCLVGFVFAFVHPHIDHKDTAYALVNWYWLSPLHRGRGIGEAMAQTLLDFLRTAKVLVVEVSEKVARAHGLWERLGFHTTDVVYRKLLED